MGKFGAPDDRWQLFDGLRSCGDPDVNSSPSSFGFMAINLHYDLKRLISGTGVQSVEQSLGLPQVKPLEALSVVIVTGCKR